MFIKSACERQGCLYQALLIWLSQSPALSQQLHTQGPRQALICWCNLQFGPYIGGELSEVNLQLCAWVACGGALVTMLFVACIPKGTMLTCMFDCGKRALHVPTAWVEGKCSAPADRKHSMNDRHLQLAMGVWLPSPSDQHIDLALQVLYFDRLLAYEAGCKNSGPFFTITCISAQNSLAKVMHLASSALGSLNTWPGDWHL